MVRVIAHPGITKSVYAPLLSTQSLHYQMTQSALPSALTSRQNELEWPIMPIKTLSPNARNQHLRNVVVEYKHFRFTPLHHLVILLKQLL